MWRKLSLEPSPSMAWCPDCIPAFKVDHDAIVSVCCSDPCVLSTFWLSFEGQVVIKLTPWNWWSTKFTIVVVTVHLFLWPLDYECINMVVASEIQETVNLFSSLMKGCRRGCNVYIPSEHFSFVLQCYCLYVRGNHQWLWFPQWP